MNSEPVTQRDLKHFEQIVESRFAELKPWIQQVSEAISRMADQRDRIIVLEQKTSTNEGEIGELKDEIKGVKEDQRAITMKLVKISAWIAAGIGFAALIIPPLLDKYLP